MIDGWGHSWESSAPYLSIFAFPSDVPFEHLDAIYRQRPAECAGLTLLQQREDPVSLERDAAHRC